MKSVLCKGTLEKLVNKKWVCWFNHLSSKKLLKNNFTRDLIMHESKLLFVKRKVSKTCSG